jgi:hypothetical protein
MFIILFIFLNFHYYKSSCIDLFNETESEKSYIVKCPTSFSHIILPGSCSCGTLPIHRFGSYFDGYESYFECYCNNDTMEYGYARAYCCNDSNIILINNRNIDIRIQKLNGKLNRKIKI